MRPEKEQLTETDQSISHDMKAKRSKWAGQAARIYSSGSLYMNVSIEGKRRSYMSCTTIAIRRTRVLAERLRLRGFAQRPPMEKVCDIGSSCTTV
ncbi:unnamed protein product [Nezara viridula]|uniref:Uncharacterized protein n=1 Tax=Nezara viridula TaxID=85310 RepID=A0A9P0HF80_NEZVI|nr:unnamed protein product [Nezara viridula]